MNKNCVKIILFVAVPLWGPVYLVKEFIKAIWEDISEYVDNKG